MRILFFSFLIAITLGSCDAMVTYQFRLQNGTTQDLYVTYTKASNDTTITLTPGNEALVLEQQELNSKTKPYFNEGDSIWWIKTLNATLPDGTPSSINLKIVDPWSFEADGDKGKYHLELKESFFE